MQKLKLVTDGSEAWLNFATKSRRKVEEQFDARVQGTLLGEIYWTLAHAKDGA